MTQFEIREIATSCEPGIIEAEYLNVGAGVKVSWISLKRSGAIDVTCWEMPGIKVEEGLTWLIKREGK